MTTFHVLGCGPAGLLAAHALADKHEVHVHSIKEPSDIRGAQFIHEQIPYATDAQPDCMVEFRKVGTKEGYADKIYGNPEHPCSWDGYDGFVPAWNMIEVYGKLWHKYEHLIHDTEIRRPYIEKLLEDENNLVISTLHPAAYDPDADYEYTVVYINEDAQFTDENVVVYNGSPDDDWYRSANIMGHGSTEVGAKGTLRNQRGFVRRLKPLRTSSVMFDDCDRFVRVGRFGEFKKGVLVHDAYKKIAGRYRR